MPQTKYSTFHYQPRFNLCQSELLFSLCFQLFVNFKLEWLTKPEGARFRNKEVMVAGPVDFRIFIELDILDDMHISLNLNQITQRFKRIDER